MIELKPFQIKNIRAIHRFEGRCLVADDMGLGKTVTTTCYLEANPDMRPAIIVCPAVVKYQWESELRDIARLRAQVIEGKRRFRGPRMFTPKIVIINFDIIQYHQEFLDSLEAKIIVVDETQKIKNPEAIRTIVTTEIGESIPHCIGLSGTPMEIRPIELYPILHMIQPELFPNFYSYAHRYCKPRRRRWGWEFKGATRKKELHKILTENLMIRNRKKDVLKDLPDKTRVIIPVPGDDMAEYKKIETDFKGWIRSQKMSKKKKKKALKAAALVQMGYLLRTAARIKMKSVLEWLDDYLERSNDKIIIFSKHKIIMKMIQARYGRHTVKIDGSTSALMRKEMVRQFNKSKNVRIMNGQLEAAGIGWSATACDTTAHLEFGWAPGQHSQAEDRTHGIGRGTGEKCISYYFACKGTIEERLCRLLTDHQKILDDVIDGGKSSGFNLYNLLMEELGYG